MLNCEEATRLMSDARERPLKITERIPLRIHVSMCSACRKFGPQMDILRNAMHRFAKSNDACDKDDGDL